MEHSQEQHIGDLLKNKRFRLRPRFTIVHHPVREKYELSMTAYAVIDSIDQLSHRPNHPWCNQSKARLAKFLGLGDATIFRAMKQGLEKGLLEKDERSGLRSTERWINEVRLYDAKDNE